MFLFTVIFAFDDLRKFIIVGLLFPPISYAWECRHGEAYAWVKLAGDSEWREAVVRNVTLKVGEPFEVKIMVKTKIKCDVDISLYEPGLTKAYEVIEGPSENGEHITIYDCEKNWTKTYRWRLQSTQNWTEGYAPLNFNVWFMRGLNDFKHIEKTIIYAYISSEKWKGNGNEGDGGKESHGGIPGFELSLLILAFLVMWRYRK